MIRTAAFLATLFFAFALVLSSGGKAAPVMAPAQPALCAGPVAAGALVEPPIVDVAALPVDALGRHELILRVARHGEAFCYRYEWKGSQQNAAPTLRVHRGERFALRLVNEISGPAAGATMSAAALAPCMPMAMSMMKPQAFAGYLNHTMYARKMPMKPLDVNIHFHGFQGPPAQENVFLSTLSTPAHACEYDITIPRTQPPGTYFYHPHAHGVSDDQVAGGLSGMWIVAPDAPQIASANEHAVIVRYRLPFTSDNPYIDTSPAIEDAALTHQLARTPVGPITSYDPFHPPLWPTYFPQHAAGHTVDVHGCGTFDTPLVSVNGTDAPARLTVPAGEPQLFRLLNATSDSFKYLRLRDASGKTQPLRIVARDGIPFSANDAQPLSRYMAMNGIILGPTGRADVLLTLAPGQTLTLYSDFMCLGAVTEYLLKHDLLTIAAGATAASPAIIASAPLAQGESRASKLLAYARAHGKSIRRRALTYTTYIVPSMWKKHGSHPEFYITETSNRNFHEAPFWPSYARGGKTPSQADIVVKAGTIEEWYLFNATLEPHTFHIHQMAFAAEDEPPAPVMLDTVRVPAGKAMPNRADPEYALVKPGLTRILLDFRGVPRGEFVFHCHMLFHEDGGMMGVIRVE